MSGPLLSKLQTDTRLFVTLCEAECTRQSPTVNETFDTGLGAFCDAFPGPGVDDLLPVDAFPMLYDCEMAVRAKNEVAAASMMAPTQPNISKLRRMA